ncbi:Uncharacterized protein APZ42_026012 [Daphnia magna]|uniref:Uncharacterized protein n=1 Tax=Daphnia magna TaxID=35525 RepID=A0A164SJH0_9CRUS|nr:Uncharacterized protein APZ42_026012 [Daphnia magna]
MVKLLQSAGVTFREPDILHGDHRLALSDRAATMRKPDALPCKRVSFPTFPSQNPLGASTFGGSEVRKKLRGAWLIYRRFTWCSQTMLSMTLPPVKDLRWTKPFHDRFPRYTNTRLKSSGIPEIYWATLHSKLTDKL